MKKLSTDFHYYKIISLVFIISQVIFPGCSGNNLTSSGKYFPADGMSTGKIVLKKSLFSEDDVINHPPVSSLKSIEIIKKENNAKREIIYFKSTFVPGTVMFRSKSGMELQLTFYRTIVDLDKDGFPDVAELNTEEDRKAFVDWFVRIAESQFIKRNFGWGKKERDCSGLIRFSYREALKKHNEKWHRRYGIVIDKNLPDVKQYNYPEIPVIGEKIFRINPGSLKKELFGVFADAETLLKFNTFLVSRDLTDAKKGDILFFFNDRNFIYPYHSMIVSGVKNNTVFVIYHTGSDDIMKLVPVEYLKKSNGFYPGKWNKNFLGIYRFHILE